LDGTTNTPTNFDFNTVQNLKNARKKKKEKKKKERKKERRRKKR
jgi:hypothetical protein